MMTTRTRGAAHDEREASRPGPTPDFKKSGDRPHEGPHAGHALSSTAEILGGGLFCDDSLQKTSYTMVGPDNRVWPQ